LKKEIDMSKDFKVYVLNNMMREGGRPKCLRIPFKEKEHYHFKEVYSDTKKNGDITFIMCYREHTDKGELQIYFDTTENIKNNNYTITYFPNDEEKNIIAFSYASHVVLPPVWNREFMEIDYLDLNAIKIATNFFLADKNLELDDEIPLTTERKGNWVAMVTESDAMEKAEKGEIYNILAMKAESIPPEKIKIVSPPGEIFEI
jgi:hypothetical protein